MPRRLARWATALGAVLCIRLAPARAHAQDRTPSRVFANDWSSGRTRAFLGWGAAAGSTSGTDLTVGYGKPYWTYLAFQADALTTRDAGMTHLRARLALVVADLAIGWGSTWSYRHTQLARAPRYASLSEDGRDAARYRTFHAGLSGFIPAPYGYIDWQTEALRVYQTDARLAVYEEGLRAVIFPAWAFVGRLGYSYQFASKRAAVGALAEGIYPGDRSEYVARIGPVFSWAFTPRIDVAATVTYTLHSPDRLDVYEDLWGNIRIRYRDATR
ncbi:MAG: hypothetical protein ABW252_00355 [Polyangiales bacterium]